MFAPRLREWFSRTPRTVRREQPRWLRPYIEWLEDRVVPAHLDFGSLRFTADAFTFNSNTNTYTAVDQVSVALTPTGNETPPTLITISPNAGGSVSIPNPATTTTNHVFTVTKASMTSVVQGVPDLEFWSTTGTAPFDADALATTGVPITSGAVGFGTADGTFTLNNIRFADPTGGDTTDAQVKLQGTLAGADTLFGLSMVVADTNFLILDGGGLTLTGVREAVSGSLTVGGLGFDVSNLSVSYSGGQFVLTGLASFDLEGESVTANFSNPGLVVQNGVLQDFQLGLTSNLDLAGVSFQTNNLQVQYTDQNSTYAVTGSASLTVDGQSVSVNFGGGGTKGLTIVNGTLAEMDVAVTSSFKLLGLELDVGTAANPLILAYSNTSGQTFTITGEVKVKTLFGASVILGSAHNKPGITITDGKFQLDNVSVELDDVNLGAFTLDKLVVSFGGGLTATADVWFPEGWKLGGTVGFTDGGELNTIGFSVQGSEGIEIADTGIMITGLSGEFQNLQHPAELIVSGSLTAVWGTGQLIQVTGGFLVDKDELILDGNVSVLDGYGSGSGRVVLDWGANDYSIEVKMGWLDGAITGDLVIDLRDGDNLYVKAEADVNVPDAIPVIGGKTLADIDFVLEWHSDPSRDSFIAAWVDAHFLFISIDIGVKYDFGSDDAEVIGAHEIHDIDQPPPVPADQTYQYDMTFTVPESGSAETPTNGLVHVRWPQAGGNQSVAITYPDGTTYRQSEFSDANGITLMQQYSDGRQYVLGLVGSTSDPYQALPAGVYTVQLTSNLQFDSSDPTFDMLASSFGFARPTIGTPQVQSNPSTQLVPITVSGKADNSLAPRVTLYYDTDPFGQNGTPIPGATDLPVTPDADGNWSITPGWDIDGLLPLPYYVYASVNDTVNGPVHSEYTGAVVPAPLLYGTVTNPENSGAPLGGMTVYLDKDDSGTFDPNTDPYTSTFDNGFYSFDSSVLPASAGTIRVGVVVPLVGFELPAGEPNPQAFSYTPGTPIIANFELNELAAIHGRVSADFSTHREPLPQLTPLQGWTVFLDANGNGALDGGEQRFVTGADGRYAFHDVPLNSTQVVRVLLKPGYYLTGATPGSYTVAVGGGKFTIYDHNDFAVMALSTVGGNVAGYALQNGSLSTNTTPLQGWTVELASGVAVDAGGGAAGSFQADQAFGGQSQVGESTTAAIDTSGVQNPAPQVVYQTNRVAVQSGDFSYRLTDLMPYGRYTVRLHFAETFFNAAGQRVFNATINGQAVLNGFDIFTAAGNRANTAVVQSFVASADDTGTVTIAFDSVTNNAQINGIEVFARQTGAAVDAGGLTVGNFQNDYGFSGGQTAGTTHAVFTGAAANPAPAAVYQSNRNGAGFTYTLNGLTPNAPYVVRLHFAETELDGPNERLFGVAINGVTVLNEFDIFAAANLANNGGGGKFVAVALPFGVTSDNSGTITLQFTGQTYNAQVNGIELLGGTLTTTTDAAGNYSFGDLFAGSYTVTQAVPAGWRQVVPFTSELALKTPAGGDVLPFPGQGGTPSSVAVADYNGDGKPDIAVLDTDQQQVAIYYNGNFANPQVFDVNDGAVAIVAADFAQTGRPSVGVLNEFGNLDVLRNDGGGNFTLSGDWFEPSYPFDQFDDFTVQGVVVGQFLPGDGSPQVAVLAQGVQNNFETTVVSIGYYTSSGENGAGSIFQSYDVAPTGMAGGDFNGDGWTDVFIATNETPLLAFGNTFTEEGQPVNGLPAGTAPVAADVNGDGLLDTGLFDGNTEFHYAVQDQNGDYTVYDSTVAAPTTTLNAAMLQDVNGDLKPDLVFLSDGNGPEQAVFVAVNTGLDGQWFDAAQTSTWSLAAGTQGGLALAAGDLDGDGLADLIVLDASGGNTQIVRNRSVTTTPPRLVGVEGGAASGTDFVNARLGQINGRVFDDVTRDGSSLPSKPGRPGVTVYVDLNRNGRLDNREPRTVTGPDGLFAFDGLRPGSFQVRYVDDASRLPTTAEGGVHQVALGRSGQPVTGLDFGNAVSREVTLTMPAGGSGDWTVVRNGSRVEVLDRVAGVVFSQPAADVHALTVRGNRNRAERLTINPAAGGVVSLPGGIRFEGGGRDDVVRVVLGGRANRVAVTDSLVRVNDGLVVRGATAGLLSLEGGGGDDTYALATRNGRVRVTDAGGRDTLDFGAAPRGVAVDLSVNAGQLQKLGGGNTLNLVGDFENLTGSAFADDLRGNGSDNVLVGGAGRDTLSAGGGNDLLVGGADRDQLFGGPGEDILIGGRTSFDANAVGLGGVLAEWTSGRTYEERVRNLIDGTGTTNRANGTTFLHAGTVVNDHAVNVLFGGPGRDWFLPFPGDQLPDRQPDERTDW